MRSAEEIKADCLRVTDVIHQLLEACAEVGDNPVIIQDEDGAEYVLTDVNHETGDVAIIIDHRFNR